MDRRPPRPSGRIRSSSASPVEKGPASPRRGISERSTSARASRSGGSGPYPVRESSDTRRGKAIPGRTAAGRTPGAGSASTSDRGLVFAGLGSAAFDFYGGDRHGDNLFANCTIALDAKTGKRVWHFQTLHHDLWDHDLPVYPNLVTVTHDGKTDRRRRAGDEDGLCLPVRPRDGQAALRRRGATRARLRRPRRTGIADAADPGQAAAVFRPVSR